MASLITDSDKLIDSIKEDLEQLRLIRLEIEKRKEELQREDPVSGELVDMYSSPERVVTSQRKTQTNKV
jgi:hypothetical protein